MESIPIIVGLLFTAIGGYLVFDTYKFRKISRQVSGRVMGYESHISKSDDGGSTTMYTPVVEFSCNGDTYCFKASISRSRMSYEVGASVPVLYLESDPHDARIRTNVRYVLGSIFALLGIVALVVGAVNFRSDGVSLMIAAGILGYFVYKGLKLKAKLNAKGISTFDDLKAMAKKSDFAANGSSMDNLHSGADKNYRSSENLIRHQADIKKRRRLPRWAAPMIIVIGVGLFFGGAYWTQKRAEFFAIAETTQGRVVSMESSYNDGSTVYYPIVNYTFPRGNQSVKFKHSVGSSHPGWRTGDAVTVLYNPTDKNEAMIDGGWMNWLGPGILAGMGVIFFIAGISTSRRQNRSRC